MINQASNVKQRLREIVPYFKGSQWAFLVAFAGAAIGAATEAGMAALMKPLIDNGFSTDGFALWLIPAAVIGLFFVRGLAGFVAGYALVWASARATIRMRKAMFDRLLGSHPSVISGRTSSSLINSVVYELQSGTNMLVNAVQTLLKDGLTVVALVGFLLWINWRLTLFVVVLFPSVALTLRAFARRMKTLTARSQGSVDVLAYVVEENVLAWRLVRLHNAAAAQRERFARASEQLRRLLMKISVATSAITPITQLLAACALSAVITMALWQSRGGGTTVGGFVSYITAMLALITPLKHLSQVAGPVTHGLTALQRGLTLAHHAPLETSGTHAPGRAVGHLALRGVSLRYRADQAVALDGVDLEIRAGETLALVGPSGGGKSTLVNLLPRFLDATEGEVLLDGVALQDWDLAALREQFALVSQDVVLFNDTVAANVSFGKPVDRQRVEAALSSANLLDFAQSLPQGIDTVIGHNGGQLSGGQRQRLAIARAIYKDAPILLLDEATSALDSESERQVQLALEKLMKGRTSVVIAHRLSTVEAADRVAVLDKGKVVEHGTHAELLCKGGLFARLHALQFRT